MSKRQHEWAYKQQGSEKVIGPVPESQFLALVKNGTIVESTLVRSITRTKNKWIAVKRIPAVAKFIKQPENPQTPTLVEDLATADEANVNPYAAPIAETGTTQPLGPPIAAKTILKRFKPLNSTVVTWLLRGAMLAMAINGLCHLCFILYGMRKVPSIEFAQMGVFVTQVILWIATGIFFLRWKYRAYANLQAACVKPLKTSAGWCVAVYFIPLINLFRPPMAMHEVQSRSKAGIGSSVIGWWLLLFVGSICERVARTAPGSDNKAGHALSIVALFMGVMAGYLLLKIIRKITEKQRRYGLFLERNSF